VKSCLIIGAGMAGLLAARNLNAHGIAVTVLDKGSIVGGRMATRRYGDGIFDYGAQFFTVRDPRFGELVEQWQAAGLVVQWTRGFADAEGHWENDGYPRYRATDGMATLPEYVSRGLDVRVNTPVVSVRAHNENWTAAAASGETFTADALILTPPVPQSLDLIAAGDVTLPQPAQQALESMTYHPCIAVLALLDGPNAIPEPGGVQFDGEPIRWIADNTRKGISPDAYAITIHGATKFSRDHWDMDRLEAGQLLIDAARPWLGTAHVREYQVHGWRYSQPVETYQDPCLVIDDPLPLVFAGDAFAGPRVEGAALSGLAAAESLLELADH